MPQPVRRRGIALSKPAIVSVLRPDVRCAPCIPRDVDRLCHLGLDAPGGFGERTIEDPIIDAQRRDDSESDKNIYD